MIIKMLKKKSKSITEKKISNYTHYMELPLKLVGCWEWFPSPKKEICYLINCIYFCFVIFVLSNMIFMLIVNMYTEWSGMMSGLEKISESFPYVASLYTVGYFTIHREKMYALIKFSNENFKYRSARGLTNMTMYGSYKASMNFAYAYLTCSLCSSSIYAVVPMIGYYWTNQPIQSWFFMDVTQSPYIEMRFLQQLLAQTIMGITLGQLGVFFASNSIILCGQLDLLCCSVRNARFTALLRDGIQHRVLTRFTEEMNGYEQHNYLYNKAFSWDSEYHYDVKMKSRSVKKIYYDIYSYEFDEATEKTLQECARVCQTVAEFKEMFETFVSPLLVVRVIQVTMYLCTLLYAASKEFNMVTVEYLLAVAFDMFIYCYYGNQIIVQASRVSTAAYQSYWHTMGVRPRRILLNILLANRRNVTIKAGRFLTMDLGTYVAIIKSSFSYYTLLANVNEK